MQAAAPIGDVDPLEMVRATTQCAYELAMAAGEIAKRSTDDTRLFLAATGAFHRCAFAMRVRRRALAPALPPPPPGGPPRPPPRADLAAPPTRPAAPADNDPPPPLPLTDPSRTSTTSTHGPRPGAIGAVRAPPSPPSPPLGTS